MNSWFVRIHFCFFVYIFQFICVTIDSCILHEERKIKMNNNKEFLATEPIGKLLLRLAIPTLAAQMINMLYNIIDRIYIGHIPGSGALALTGVGVWYAPDHDYLSICCSRWKWWCTSCFDFDGEERS